MGWFGSSILRDDEQKTFVVTATGETCVWKASRKCLWHATVDGLHRLLVHGRPRGGRPVPVDGGPLERHDDLRALSGLGDTPTDHGVSSAVRE